MIKRLLPLFMLLAFLTGCANAVRTDLSERYAANSPRTVAVVPVFWQADAENKEVGYTFRMMTVEKLKDLNYRVVPPAAVDDTYIKLGSSSMAGKSPAELAGLLNADAVLFIKIKTWNIDRFVTYASLKVEAAYELYSATGERLWQAEYATKDADLRLDRKSMEYAIIKAYEPKVQRFVDAIFSTLPQAQAQTNARSFFQWLP
ncbi:MAG: DUF799 family lipoprotein [Deltaproteobacteria bacterium]|nr:DUF799 family lipoprotein [Deltaproteobacteria bacterium]